MPEYSCQGLIAWHDSKTHFFRDRSQHAQRWIATKRISRRVALRRDIQKRIFAFFKLNTFKHV